jgi:hypothetical protein
MPSVLVPLFWSLVDEVNSKNNFSIEKQSLEFCHKKKKFLEGNSIGIGTPHLLIIVIHQSTYFSNVSS